MFSLQPGKWYTTFPDTSPSPPSQRQQLRAHRIHGPSRRRALAVFQPAVPQIRVGHAGEGPRDGHARVGTGLDVVGGAGFDADVERIGVDGHDIFDGAVVVGAPLPLAPVDVADLGEEGRRRGRVVLVVGRRTFVVHWRDCLVLPRDVLRRCRRRRA